MTLEYSTDLFEADMITRLLANFQVLLEGIVQNPQARIADLPLLTPAERERLLVEWNATQQDYQKDVCVHQFFEQQVGRTPDAGAVVFEDEMLTYAMLNQRANQLAHHLQGLGIGPDNLVGICIERSLEMVVGLLGVLKAGSAYVPLDPTYPQERLALMIADSLTGQVQGSVPTVGQAQGSVPTTPRVVLMDRLFDGFADGVQVINLNTDWQRIAALSPENPQTGVRPANLAYVIYTSGSTGKPKGVMNTHQGLCNRLHWMQQAYHLTHEDRVLQKTPFSFDVSVWEFFWPLLTGANLIMACPGGHQDPSYLKLLIAQQAVTTLHFVPSMLQAFLWDDPTGERPLEKSWAEKGTSLRQVMCSGEVLSSDLQAHFFAQVAQEVQLHNLYGPTEAAIDVTSWPCRRSRRYGIEGRGTDPGSPQVPIGRPIANIQIYLLDGNFQPVPIGVTGELYIGGVGLARGYVNRPQLTAERFIPNPFVSVGTGHSPVREGTRLYCTGDLARYRADGVIEYVGRIDQQIKLRGFRIELGEIEAILLRHPAIQTCAVLMREDRPGEKQLIAYCVVRQGLVGEESRDKPSPYNDGGQEREELFVVGAGFIPASSPHRLHAPVLRTYLQDRLPAYMIPATFVLLDNLPRMPNGKVDRHALATKVLEPGTGSIRNRTVVAPRTSVEKALAAIWTDLLHLEQVSISDNFFEVGGHSLLAVQLLNRMNKQFGLSLSLAMLFQIPTIEQAAALLQKDVKPEPVTQGTGQGRSLSAPTAASTSSCVAIQPFGEKRPFFWVHPGHGDIYCYLDLAKHLRHDRPFYGIQAPGLRSQCDYPTGEAGELTPQVFNSIEEMATSYIEEILAVQPDGPYFIGGYSFGGLVAFEMTRQLKARGRSVALLVLLDSYLREPEASPVPTNPLSTMKDYAKPMVRIVERLGWKKKVSLSYEILSRLQPDEQLAHVLDRLREERLVPDDMDISQLRRYIQVREAHDSHSRNYRPKPYAGRITLFRSEVAEEDPSLWTPFSAEPVEVHTVSGEHNLMVYEPYVAPLAVQLQQCLDKADRI